MKLLNRAEMAKLFRQSVGTIRDWERQGQLKSKLPAGRHPLYDPRDLWPEVTDADVEEALGQKPSLLTRKS